MRYAKTILFAALLMATIMSGAEKAQAFESPLDKLASKYKEIISKEKRVTVYNQKQKTEVPPKMNFEEFIENQMKNSKGDHWDWRKVEEAVRFASEKTGVRKEFLFGMLAVESDLGRNTGECSYEEVEEGAKRSFENGNLSLQSWKTFQRRKNLIRGIADDLGYDYRDLRVSCNPAQYTGTGGALGVPQFMPDTWLEYKARIAKVVGKDHPDPWDLKDGVVAMALKLSDCPGVVSHNRVAEKNAAKLYLSGTTSWRYNWYANLIQYWSENYKRLMV